MPAIETIDLTKDYAVGFWRKRPKRVLEDLNLEVASGEVFGLLGPNGAGKSTTLKLILRLIFPTSGAVRIFGSDWRDVSLRARIGFLPENPSFYDNLSAEEFLNYAGSLFREAYLLEQLPRPAPPLVLPGRAPGRARGVHRDRGRLRGTVRRAFAARTPRRRPGSGQRGRATHREARRGAGARGVQRSEPGPHHACGGARETRADRSTRTGTHPTRAGSRPRAR